MPRRSWICFALALLVSVLDVAVRSRPGASLVYYGAGPACPPDDGPWSGPGFSGQALSIYAGPVLVVLAIVVVAVATARGRALTGRVVVRVLAGVLLLICGHGGLVFGFDLIRDVGCHRDLLSWGELLSSAAPFLPPFVAAALMVLAVGHRR
ncbi:hypothetical protein [Herbidospora sp. RD11066]